MNQSEIQDVYSVFKKQTTFDSDKYPAKEGTTELINEELKVLKTLDRSTFLTFFFDYLDYTLQFQKIRTLLFIELGVRPQKALVERKIIQIVLDQSLDLN